MSVYFTFGSSAINLIYCKQLVLLYKEKNDEQCTKVHPSMTEGPLGKEGKIGKRHGILNEGVGSVQLTLLLQLV